MAVATQKAQGTSVQNTPRNAATQAGCRPGGPHPRRGSTVRPVTATCVTAACLFSSSISRYRNARYRNAGNSYSFILDAILRHFSHRIHFRPRNGPRRLRFMRFRCHSTSFFEPDPFPATKRAGKAPFEAFSMPFRIIFRAGSVSGHETGREGSF